MNTTEIDRILQQTLTDYRISSSEKKALADWIAGVKDDPNAVALIRSRAFDLVRHECLDPAAKQMVGWLEEVVKILHKPEPRTAGTFTSQAFFSPGFECVSEVIRQFNTSRKSCDVCVFTITDDRITNSILRAFARGVEIRIITDDDKAEDLGSDIEQLKRAGIRVKFDHTPFHMHHKFALFDADQLLTGSFNWTRSATENNEENLIVTSDPTLVNAFVQRFERLWTKLENA